MDTRSSARVFRCALVVATSTVVWCCGGEQGGSPAESGEAGQSSTSALGGGSSVGGTTQGREAAGVDGGAGAGLVTDPASPEVEQFCTDGATSNCDILGPCCSVAIAACVEQRRSSCLEGVTNSLERGFGFDPVAAAACIQGIATLYQGCQLSAIGVYQSDYDVCARVTVGMLPVGADCQAPQQCWADAGQVARCVEATCQVASARGEGDSCDTGNADYCGAGLYCSNQDGTSVCRPQKTEGDSCEGATACRLPTTCSNGVCAVLSSMDAVCASLVADDA
jgi:hypothetical protein